jgi:putative hemolysin
MTEALPAVPIRENRGERRLSIRLARDADDLRAVQELRWQVFFAERGAAAITQASEASTLLDHDAYDDLCDHLLVIDEAAPAGACVVGTYRLLRESVARTHSGFYSAGEYDLSQLVSGEWRQSGELLELGRSCVLPPYRTSGTISLLWRGISEYIAQHGIALMFGCASFQGVDPDAHAPALSWLYHNHLAPAGMCPRVLPALGLSMDLLAPGSFDERQAMLNLPPLIKGYLRTGAMFGDGAFVDHAFNTVDVCVVLPVDRIADRYATRFSVAA